MANNPAPLINEAYVVGINVYRTTLLAAAMMHMEGFYSTKSLASRTNNPGNLEDDKGEKKTYSSKLSGYIAMISDIKANSGKTIREFLTKYAPPSENDTDLYIDVVCAITGFHETDNI